jgi:malonyl CoA-acyl carrier protein transacylase
MNKPTNSKKQRVVVICPGRGTYNKEELGYLKHHHGDKKDLVDCIDQYRSEYDQISIADLDAMEKYNLTKHTAGENASALIYGCARADFQDINQDLYEIVAVTGNSMGWYIALALAGALNEVNAIKVINTMGSMMSDGVIGGQLIYPIVNENWQVQSEIKSQTLKSVDEVNKIADHQVYVSIELGGYLVFGGNKLGLKALERKLPVVQDKYPMNLFNHAAFHTPLLKDTADKAQTLLPSSLFSPPEIPLIDGRGKIWQPLSTDAQQLYSYTLNTQVVEPYNFSRAIEVAVKEFAPDKLIILGPGSTLGGSVAQCLIVHQWLGLNNKSDFIQLQKSTPYLLAMGLSEQRKYLI